MKTTLIATLLFLVFEGGLCDEQKNDVIMIEEKIIETMNQLGTLDERSRMKLLSQTDEQRSELLAACLKHLGKSSSNDVQAAAIYMIGSHRLGEGAPELIKVIEFEPGTKPRRGPEPLWEKYPAMEALIKIGKPAIPVILELLATDPDELRRTLAVKVIRYVEGVDVSTFILQNAEEKELETKRKSLLGDAVVSLKKLAEEDE